MQSAEALLLARYFMFSQVYFHPVRRIYDIHLKDFLCRNGRLKLREQKDFQTELISYIRPDSSGPKLSKYTRVKVENTTALKEALASALGIKGVVKKRGRLFMVGQTRLHLDKVDGLGDFLEIEVVLSENQREIEGKKIADEIMNKLGISQLDLVDRAYIDLIECNGHVI